MRRSRPGGVRPGPWGLASVLLIGVVLGQILASGLPEETVEGLYRLLEGRIREGPAPVGQAALPTALLYLRWPLLGALFASGGGAFLYGTAAAFGASLAFPVRAFAAAFGRGGALLAAAVLGIRCLVTVPCFLLLAVPPGPPVRRGVRWDGGARPPGQRRARTVRLILCVAILLAGACVDLLCGPSLLRWAAARVLD